MAKLAEGLARFFGRVEILARGADDDRRAAEKALARGHVLEARAHARSLLRQVPRSPLGLALWADAAEACWLDDEVVRALSQLADQVPWRQEVWLRLGLAGTRAGWPDARAALERAASSRDDLAVSRSALLALADADLATGEIARATRWLDRIPSHPSTPDAELALRRAECAFAVGDADAGKSWTERTDGLDATLPSLDGETTLGARRRLLRARVAMRFVDDDDVWGHPITLALGAYVLGAPGAEELLAEVVAGSRDAALVAQARQFAVALGHSEEPRWQAAFALAEGRRDDARGALIRAVESGDAAAAQTLLALATQWQDREALETVAEHQRELVPASLLGVLKAAGEPDAERALGLLEQSCQGEAEKWAAGALFQLVGEWVGRNGEPSTWEDILRELRRAATALDRMDLASAIEALSVERSRPLFVAVLGEFNAGKSTMLNALLGTDVAPTGVRPTTASLHWTAWAPDPFARVVVRGGSDRVVPHDELKRTLTELREQDERVERVLIYAPIERLKRIEILDTPGFNAPDTTHAEEAKRGIEEAHVALWLLDATAPLKDSERQVIESIAKAGVPVQVLVNKRDRVGEDQIDTVMAYLEGALAETNIASLEPPVAFSAQLGLKGRLGDAEALAASHWQDVETLLSEHIVNRRDALRERALRRKAGAIARDLATQASAAIAEHESAREQAQQLADQRAQLATQLRSDREKQAIVLMKKIHEALSALQTDARPVEELAEERRTHAEVRSYLVDRTVERIAPALHQALIDMAPEAAIVDVPIIRQRIESTLAGAASARVGRLLKGGPLQAAIEQSLLAVSDALDGMRAVSEQSEGRGLALRLSALNNALHR